MPRPPNINDSGVVFLPDGHLVIAYAEAEVTPMKDGGLLVTVPVAYYSEEWDWLAGGSVHLGAEPQHVAVKEALAWHKGRASLTVAP